MVEVCAAHLHEAPARPSRALGRAIPEELEELVLACLAKDPEARPGSAGALRRTLLASRVAGARDERRAAACWAARVAADHGAPDVA